MKTMKCMNCGREKPIEAFRIAPEYYKFPVTRGGRIMHCGCKHDPEVRAKEKVRKRAVCGMGGYEGDFCGGMISNMGVPGCHRMGRTYNRNE